MRPTEAGTAAVLRWLHAAGASSVTVVATADFVRATIAAANASRLWSAAATPRCAPLCTPRSRLRYTTGGGFSRTFQQPAWQATAVSGYLGCAAVNASPKQLFNAAGRGYNDVAVVRQQRAW